MSTQTVGRGPSVLASPVLIAGMFGMNGTLTHTGIVLGVAATAIGLTKPVWMQMFHAFQRLQQFFDDWFGEPARPGQALRPGAMARLAELENNGGSSIKDTVDRIETKLAAVSDQADHAVLAASQAVQEAKDGVFDARPAVVLQLGEAGHRTGPECLAGARWLTEPVVEELL